MEEIVEVLSHSGEYTGKLVSKEHAHRRGLWHATVHIWLLNDKSQFLLQRRSVQKEIFPGLWDVSVAGHIEAGESPEEAACREISEELGLEVPASGLAHFGRLSRETLHSLQNHDREWQDLFILPLENTPQLALNSTEVQEIKWLDIKELFLDLRDRSYLMTPMHREVRLLAREIIG